MNFAAQGNEKTLGFKEAIQLLIADRNIRATLGKRYGNRLTQAGRCAGYQGHFSLQ